MSEHITHLAVAEDSARVVSNDPEFNAILLDSIRRFPRALRLGSTTRSGDAFILPLLTKWREDWKENDPRTQKLAYILGWSGHLAADRTFKPVFRITDLAHYTRGFPGPADASIYHDAIMFSQAYHNGQDPPFRPSALMHDLKGHPAADYVPVSHVESSIGATFRTQLASIKTFLPEQIEDWEQQWKVQNNEKQKFNVDLDRYTAAHHHPDPSQLRQFIIEPNFYNPEDPIIRMARDMQEKGKTDVKLSDALEGTENQSLYAQSLKLGYDFLKTCSDYFGKKISLDQAKVNFRIGKPHKQPLDYYIKMAQEAQGD